MSQEIEPRPSERLSIHSWATTVDFGEIAQYHQLTEKLPDYHLENLFEGRVDDVDNPTIPWSKLSCQTETSHFRFGVNGYVLIDEEKVKADAYWQEAVAHELQSLLIDHAGVHLDEIYSVPQDSHSMVIKINEEAYARLRFIAEPDSYGLITLETLPTSEFYRLMRILPPETPRQSTTDKSDNYRTLLGATKIWSYLHDAAGKRYDQPHPIQRRLTLSAPTENLFIPKIEKIDETALSFDDIAGYEAVKNRLMEIAAVNQHPELAANIGLSSSQAVLLYGAPGTGKTSLLKAFANEIDAELKEISVTQVVDKWVGSSARNLDRIFANINPSKRTVILFDEFDSIAAGGGLTMNNERNDVINRLKDLVTQITANRPNVLVTAATNNLERIDPTLLRSGRFEAIEVMPPSEADRRAILSLLLGRVAATAVIKGDERPDLPTLDLSTDIDINALARHSSGLVGADFQEIINDLKRERLLGYLQTKEMPPLDQQDVSAKIEHYKKDI